MSIQKRIGGLSKATKEALLAGESESVDFKKIPGGVSTEDIVSFANTAGGQLLLGVIEKDDVDTQIGEVVGCDVSDGAVLQLLNKATSCIPPIALKIFTENLDDKPILRVVIPQSETKPHCTPKGLFLKREGTRNRALHPQELLEIFLQIEASAFSRKFESAAAKIGADIAELEESLDDSIRRMADQLGWADFQLGDTESTVDTILAIVSNMREDIQDSNLRLRALFLQDERNDPVRQIEFRKFREALQDKIREDEELRAAVVEGHTLTFEATGRAATLLSKDELKKAYEEAVTAIRAEADAERYSREIKMPASLSDAEIDTLVSLIERGGQVADGVRARMKAAKAIGMVLFDGHPVGVAAIKKPLKAYAEKVFSKSKSEASAEGYNYELGWIYLKENHRQKGLMTPLLEEMLQIERAEKIFATTRSSNLIMKELLVQFGFRSSGTPYQSTEHPDESISLYIKEPGRED